MTLAKIAMFGAFYGGSLRSLRRVIRSRHKPVGRQAKRAQFAAVVRARRYAVSNMRALDHLYGFLKA